jgi:hypothetical protein
MGLQLIILGVMQDKRLLAVSVGVQQREFIEFALTNSEGKLIIRQLQ